MILNFEDCRFVVEKQLAQLNIANKIPAGLYQPADYVLATGGKRVRPALALMACNLFSDDIARALMPAAALEIFHNFTLLHDDVMDNADTRHNMPAVHRRWNENTAILSGDALMILAFEYMQSVTDGKTPTLMNILTRTALQVCEGQQYDMDFERRTDVSIDEYMCMIRLKTAVLIAASLETGALCGGAGKDDCERLGRFGTSLGLAFQIQDDWLDVYADPAVLGKSTGTDILCGKKNFMLLTAFERGDDSTRHRLIAIIDDCRMAAHDKIERVRAEYDRLGVSEAAQQAVNLHFEQAAAHLQEVAVNDSSRKAAIEMFAEKLRNRKS